MGAIVWLLAALFFLALVIGTTAAFGWRGFCCSVCLFAVVFVGGIVYLLYLLVSGTKKANDG